MIEVLKFNYCFSKCAILNSLLLHKPSAKIWQNISEALEMHNLKKMVREISNDISHEGCKQIKEIALSRVATITFPRYKTYPCL